MPKGDHESESEIRQDLITGKWVVVAAGRSKRPHDGSVEGEAAYERPAHYEKGCPFCELKVFRQEPDIVRLPDDDEKWQVHVFSNKYPALRPGELMSGEVGPYRWVSATGYHEVLAWRWHDQDDHLLTQKEWGWQVEALVARFRQLKEEQQVNYIQIIKNHGVEAGQSLTHPHMQLFTIPVLPSDVADILRGAETYAKSKGREVFADLLEFERSEGNRVVWENEQFTVFCPYASRVPYEMWIVSKEANPFFENIGPEEQQALAESLLQAMRRLHKALGHPPYNFYIHSAPCDDRGFVCDKETFKHFRWHVQILPRITNWGGFELGTGLEINTVLPEAAAAHLREQRIMVVE